jgi:hypothetical protein
MELLRLRRKLVQQMTAIVHKLVALELHASRRAQRRDAAGRRLSLRATEDGWSLIAPDGHLVFRGFGLDGRRRCLEFARDLGVLAVLG